MDEASGNSGPPAGARGGRWVWPWVLSGCAAVGLIGLAAAGILVGRRLADSRRERTEVLLRSHCKSNLRQIGLACHLYADDSDEQFPPDLATLWPTYADNPIVFVCRAARLRRGAGASGSSGALAADYEYLPGRDAALPGEFLLAIDGDLTNHAGKGFNVLFVDAHVEWWPAARVEELRRLLDEQDRVVEAVRAAPAKRDALIDAWRRARQGAGGAPPTHPARD